ncbi:acyl-homoserine-lactone synthase [Bradyrhizobium sp. 149]|uniref:acyl-homoserine-lactone synthase n=1 Tax=Bradyrhizobium sp. 149 TaxID=2782624 RepID=UPI001FF92F4F|nr:acyl-homoserine-lactone synthase [Bradyrhizobium sp. 149]MCK1651590.1 acyl-homoserine-lactone synthase [Bradyrhizobium sp. 149]
MIRIITNADRSSCLGLLDEMFRARAAIFSDRLRWNVDVRHGWEFDRYDVKQETIYLICVADDGHTTGSLRLLPANGDTMLQNEFAPFFDRPPKISDRRTWECTRFCVHPCSASEGRAQNRYISSQLLIGLCEFALASGMEHIVGLYDHAMTRVYRRIGWSPSPIAISRPQVGRLVVGTWDVSHDALNAMTARAITELENLGFERRAA